MQHFKLLTFNIHKGYNLGNREQTLSSLKNSIAQNPIDFLFLQEVIGDHQHPKNEIKNFISNAQYHYLAEDIYPYFHYGKNAVYQKGHHGNAILSKHELEFEDNLNLSLTRLEQRGMLHLTTTLNEKKINLLCTHLNLRHPHRIEQVEKIIYYINKKIDPTEALILCGDFNDWTAHLSKIFFHRLKLKEASQEYHGKHLKTFPAFVPLLPLDRIYYRNLNITFTKVMLESEWKKISDHLAIYAEFTF